MEKVKETIKKIRITIDAVLDTRKDIDKNLLGEYVSEKLESLEALSKDMTVDIQEEII